MKYFVTADVHGFYDELILALKQKGFDENDSSHILIICGDLFDRGDKPQQIIDFVNKLKKRVILIRGNHEDLMEEMLRRGFPLSHEEHNGTIKTIMALNSNYGKTEFNLRKIAVDSGLQKILDSTVDYLEIGDYIFVHAWIPTYITGYPDEEDWRKADSEAWQRARWVNPVKMYKYKTFEKGKIIVCGHYPCSALWEEREGEKYSAENENHSPFIDENIIGLDASTYKSHIVNVIVIEK